MPSAVNHNSAWLRRVMRRTFRSRQTPLTAMSLRAASSTGRSRSAASERCDARLHPHMQSGAVFLRQGLQTHHIISLTACTCSHKCAASTRITVSGSHACTRQCMCMPHSCTQQADAAVHVDVLNRVCKHWWGSMGKVLDLSDAPTAGSQGRRGRKARQAQAALAMPRPCCAWAGVSRDQAGRPGMPDRPGAPNLLAVALLRRRVDAVPDRGRVHGGLHTLCFPGLPDLCLA